MSLAVVCIPDHHLPDAAAHLAGDLGPDRLPVDVATADLVPVLPDDRRFLLLCVHSHS